MQNPLSFPIQFIFNDITRFYEELNISYNLATFKSIGKLFHRLIKEYRNKDRHIVYDNEEINIGSDILQDLSPNQKWKQIRDWLVENNYITTHGYTVNVKNIGIVLKPRFKSLVTFNGSIEDKIKLAKETYPEHINLIDNIIHTQKYFKIDISEFKDKEIIKQFLGFLASKEIDSKTFKELKTFLSKIKNIDIPKYFVSRVNFMNNFFFNGKDNYSGRVHNPVVTLKQELKSCLRTSNGTMSEIDISNSQYFFLALKIYKEKIEGNHELFIKHCKKGILYNEIAKHVNLSRNEVKIEMMFMLFKSKGDNVNINKKDPKNKKLTDEDIEIKKCNRKIIMKAMIELYPDTWKWIESQKPIGRDEDNKKTSYYFCQDLQKMEVDFIFNKVVPILISKNIFYLTRHDSLIVERDQDSKIFEIVKSEMNKLELQGTIKLEKLTIKTK